jgi:RNA polymerase sigma-70 factor, ECF subfamily
MFDRLPQKEVPQGTRAGLDIFEGLTPEQIREKITNPQDPIHEPIRRLIHGTVRNLILSSTHPAYDLVEDLTQEVLLKVWKNIGSFRGDSDFKTWVIAITRNAFISRIRSRNRHENKTDSLEQIAENNGHNLPESDLSPSEKQIVENLGNQQFFDSLKGSLAPGEFQLLEMRFREDLSYGEIGKRLHIKEKTIKTRFYRLFEKIRGVNKKNMQADG